MEELIKINLAEDLEKYVKIIIEEYKNYIPKERLDFLNSITNYEQFIFIEETGTISMLVKGNNIYFPKSAFKILEEFSSIPGFGSDKNHICYNDDNLIINDNTYEDYIKHVMIKGITTEEFYKENLLHETMHFCGSGGWTALREGLTELKTRKLAQKYKLNTSGCGYPKEIKIVLELQRIFGEEAMNKIAFSKDRGEIVDILGLEQAEFYFKIERAMEEEFYDKYMKYKFPGLTGPIEKTKKYNEIDYSKVYDMLEEYKNHDTKNLNSTRRI